MNVRSRGNATWRQPVTVVENDYLSFSPEPMRQIETSGHEKQLSVSLATTSNRLTVSAIAVPKAI